MTDSSPQSKTASFVEAVVNMLLGFSINYCANLLILPLFFHREISLSENFYLGLLYTVISIVRSYCVRRWFNKGILNALVDSVMKRLYAVLRPIPVEP